MISRQTALVALLMSILFSGCNRQEKNKADGIPIAPKMEANALSFQLPLVWLHTDSEPPEMRLFLSDKGICTFQGGFLFWNPGQWHFDSQSAQLTLSFPKMSKKDFASMLKEAQRDQIVSSDPLSKSISYKITKDAPQFSFQGRTFFAEPTGPK